MSIISFPSHVKPKFVIIFHIWGFHGLNRVICSACNHLSFDDIILKIEPIKPYKTPTNCWYSLPSERHIRVQFYIRFQTWGSQFSMFVLFSKKNHLLYVCLCSTKLLSSFIYNTYKHCISACIQSSFHTRWPLFRSFVCQVAVFSIKANVNVGAISQYIVTVCECEANLVRIAQ